MHRQNSHYVHLASRSLRMFVQDGIGFAYQGHKIVIELINGDNNDLAGQKPEPLWAT